MFVVQKQVVVAGGADARCQALDSCEVFEGQHKAWRTVGPLNKRRLYPVAATWSDKLFVFGGRVEQKALDDTEEYDSKAEKWTILNDRLMKVGRHDMAAAYLHNSVYLLGGSSSWELKPLQSAERFVWKSSKFQRVAPLPEKCRASCCVVVTATDELLQRICARNCSDFEKKFVKLMNR